MTIEDKFIGMRDNERIYCSFRVDYNSEKDPRKEGAEVGSMVKIPPKNYEAFTVKDSYSRKALCEDKTSKDEIVDWCEANNVSYVVEEIQISSKEKQAVESYSAETGLEGQEALKWLRALEDLQKGKISRKEFELGNNTNRGEKFNPPNKGKAKN